MDDMVAAPTQSGSEPSSPDDRELRVRLAARVILRGDDGEHVDFGFPPPTRVNLAKLRLTIPPGFKRA